MAILRSQSQLEEESRNHLTIPVRVIQSGDRAQMQMSPQESSSFIPIRERREERNVQFQRTTRLGPRSQTGDHSTSTIQELRNYDAPHSSEEGSNEFFLILPSRRREHYFTHPIDDDETINDISPTSDNGPSRQDEIHTHNLLQRDQREYSPVLFQNLRENQVDSPPLPPSRTYPRLTIPLKKHNSHFLRPRICNKE